MVNYPTQLDEIDQWLADNFGIIPGACSSTENLRHTTARMIAEALWPKCKETLPKDLDEAAEKFARSYDQGTCDGIAQDCFKAGANWQAEQDKETIELAEEHAMLAGMVKAEEQMKKDAIERTVKEDAGGYPYIDATELYDYDNDKPLAKKGDKVKVYIFKN